MTHPETPRGWTGVGLAAALAVAGLLAVAYRDLLWAPLAGGGSVGAAAFDLGALPPPLVLAASAWLLFERRERIPVKNPLGPFDRVVAASTLLLAFLALVWVRLSEKVDLAFISLAALLLGIATLRGGTRGARAAGLPATVLGFGLAIPRPFESEIVWRLQLWTARWANELLVATGREFRRAGVVLRDGEHTFQVVDTCSGLTGTMILLLIAVLVRELLRLDAWRTAVLVIVTPVVASLVNILRVTYVAGSPNPRELAGIGADHTWQGVIVLMLGTFLVYGLGLLLASVGPDRDANRGEHDAVSVVRWPARRRAWLLAAAVVLAAGSLVPPRPAPAAIEARQQIRFPDQKPGWRSAPAPDEPLFYGKFEQSFHHRYRRRADARMPNQFVDLLIARIDPSVDFASRALGPKRLHPGPDWNVDEKEPRRLWALDREVERAVCSPTEEGEHALVYVWRVGHPGLFIASLHSFLGLDRDARFGPPLRPLLVKLVSFSPHGRAGMLARAHERLDQFIGDFQSELLELESGARSSSR